MSCLLDGCAAAELLGAIAASRRSASSRAAMPLLGPAWPPFAASAGPPSGCSRSSLMPSTSAAAAAAAAAAGCGCTGRAAVAWLAACGGIDRRL